MKINENDKLELLALSSPYLLQKFKAYWEHDHTCVF